MGRFFVESMTGRDYPMIMAAWKLGPALSTGNSVVLKPSEKSPLSALRVAELAVEAGLPEGVLNVLPGFGDTAGRRSPQPGSSRRTVATRSMLRSNDAIAPIPVRSALATR